MIALHRKLSAKSHSDVNIDLHIDNFREAAQMKRTSMELFLVDKLCKDGDGIRDIETNGSNRRDGRKSGAVTQSW